MLSFIVNQTNDYCAIPQVLKDELAERYPEARRAYLKTGGDFPFLSRPDEVNLHLQVTYVYSASTQSQVLTETSCCCTNTLLPCV